MRPAPALTMSALLALASAPAAGQPASAPAAEGSGPSAAAACERAARSTVGTGRGAAAEVSFNAPPAVVPGPADSSEVVLRGGGRARGNGGTRTFTYSCNFDTRSGEVSGVVVRDTTTEGATVPSAVRSVEPDLSAVSPVACESAAAAALKQRWPAVSRITFNGATRTMEQDSAGNAALRGQGSALPAPNAPSTHFSYTCAIDPRNGRILATRIAS